MYNLYFNSEEMKGNTIFAQHTAVGEEDEQYSMPYTVIAYGAHGSGIHHVGKEQVEFREGDIVLIHRDVVNCFYTKEGKLGEIGGLSMYICVLDEKAFSTAITGLKRDFKDIKPFFDGEKNCLYAHDTEQKDIRNLFVEMLDEITYVKQGYKEKVSSLVKTMLVDFFRLNSMGYTGENYLYSNKVMGEIINYINRNIYARLSLANTAKTMHITPQHLCRLFKKYMNMTFTEYVNNKRMEIVKDELEHTDRPIYLIYDDFELTGAYLNKLFKQYTGYSMADYKEKFNYKKHNPLYTV